MNEHVVRHFLAGESAFSRVVALHEEDDHMWEVLQEECPTLPRGWFELARLSSEDRLEFVRGYWGSILPYVPHVDEAIDRFFGQIDDIGIYLTQQGSDDPLKPQLVYSLGENIGFFTGSPPPDIEKLERDLSFCSLPADYLAFLGIHDHFQKADDSGLIPARKMGAAYSEFQELLNGKDPLTFPGGEECNPESLIPFYQSFGLQSFQCFYKDWYPEQEMGNLYYSGLEHTISNYKRKATPGERLAFPTFLDWLAFYLESVLS